LNSKLKRLHKQVSNPSLIATATLLFRQHNLAPKGAF
jgi:hypothetical protein